MERAARQSRGWTRAPRKQPSGFPREAPRRWVGPRPGRRGHRHGYVYCDMLLCMRTTLEIGDELFRRVKRRAVNEGATFRAVVETALTLYLSKGSRRAPYR
jgi:Arc/MetJ family transcription regulator